MAVQLAKDSPDKGDGHPTLDPDQALALEQFAPGQQYLRGLFAGGTLAYEALLLLQDYLPAVYSNVPLKAEFRLATSLVSQEHTIVDLGEDEFTVGRLHPMMDNDLRLRRLQQEALDPQVAVILLDVVLGFGAHPDPAGELAPAILQARSVAQEAGRFLEVVAVVVGTDEDPQDLHTQMQQLVQAGAHVETSNDAAVRYAGHLLQALASTPTTTRAEAPPPVDLSMLTQPLAALNVGLESFTASLKAQDAPVLQVDWRPPAGGNERLMAILEKMRG
jgi:FdrA protein